MPLSGALCGLIIVALRKESVDRNPKRSEIMKNRRVALRKESVDRNCGLATQVVGIEPSLSARRAWIEIPKIL